VTDHRMSPLSLFLADILGAGLAGHIAHALALLPGWAGGILGGLVVHIIGRLLAPTLDEHGQRIKWRLTGKHKAQPPKRESKPPPPDDTTD